MRETSKASRRRYIEEFQGGFAWKSLLQGKGIDIGPGDDLLPVEGCQGFDMEDGDANVIHEYFPENHFNYVHASQCLEHMHDPNQAIRNWVKIVKPSGHLIITIPDWDLYEGRTFPSRWNPDHKASFSMSSKESSAPIHIYIPHFLKSLEDVAKTVLYRLVDTNYNYDTGTSVDQTYDESAGVEAFIEIVLQKK